MDGQPAGTQDCVSVEIQLPCGEDRPAGVCVYRVERQYARAQLGQTRQTCDRTRAGDRVGVIRIADRHIRRTERAVQRHRRIGGNIAFVEHHLIARGDGLSIGRVCAKAVHPVRRDHIPYTRDLLCPDDGLVARIDHQHQRRSVNLQMTRNSTQRIDGD